MTQIVEQKRWQNEVNPRDPDWLAAKVAHVGVERFGSSHRQDHRAQSDKRANEIRGEEVDGVERVEHRQDDLGLVHDVDQSKHRERREIDKHDRTEHQAEPCRGTG